MSLGVRHLAIVCHTCHSQAPSAERDGWVQVYSNFRGSGGNTRLKQEAASSAVKFGIKSQARKSGGKMPMSGFGEV